MYRETGRKETRGGRKEKRGEKKEGREKGEARWRNEKRSWRKRRGAGEWISLSTPSVMVQRFCGQLLVFNTDLPNLAYNICIQ